MKAVVALILIYIGTFLVALQGSSNADAQTASQASAAQKTSANIDPAKEADIRSLLELVGARDLVQDSMTRGAEQYREKLLETVPNNQAGQAFVNTVITGYEKRFDVDSVTEQLVSIYDKHYTADEIKGLLQFYGSPLGQKVANESPKIAREIQDATRATSAKAVREALQEAKQDNPGIGQNARLNNGQPTRRFAGRRNEGSNGSAQAPAAQAPADQQQSAQQQDPQ